MRRNAWAGFHRLCDRVSSRRLRWGPFSVYLEPRDMWRGLYVARDALYICPGWAVVIKIHVPPPDLPA